MSRIDDLIAELCPDGVPLRKISDVSTKGISIKWSHQGQQQYRYIDLGAVDLHSHRILETQVVDADTAPSRAQQLVQAGDIIFATTRPTQLRWAIISEEYDQQVVSTGYCVIRPDASQIHASYLAHLLGTATFGRYVEANQVMGNYPSIPDSRVRSYRVPVPPLEVQREIVRVLDKFTQLEAELRAELEAELEARRRQYEYYRDQLLTFDEAGGGPIA